LNPYGVNRWILRANKENVEVLDIRPYFPQTLDGLGFSAFHVVRSILSISFFFDLFYHNFVALIPRPLTNLTQDTHWTQDWNRRHLHKLASGLDLLPKI
jgi:hypothetical protein